MYILHFVAGANDIIGISSLSCEARYCNVQLSKITSVTPGNQIQRIANIDVTQFIAVLGYQYAVNMSNNTYQSGNPIGRSYSFAEMQTKGIISTDYTYVSGPTLICPNDVAWLLYSVTNKLPVKVVINDDQLPPDVTPTNGAVVKLDVRTTTEGSEDANTYFQFYFPTPPSGEYRITFESAVGDVVFATRINGVGWKWQYRYNDIIFDTNHFTTIVDTDIIFEVL